MLLYNGLIRVESETRMLYYSWSVENRCARCPTCVVTCKWKVGRLINQWQIGQQSQHAQLSFLIIKHPIIFSVWLERVHCNYLRRMYPQAGKIRKNLLFYLKIHRWDRKFSYAYKKYIFQCISVCELKNCTRNRDVFIKICYILQIVFTFLQQ